MLLPTAAISSARTTVTRKETREDMHTSDTVQEKLSLVYRFGVTIYFGAPQ